MIPSLLVGRSVEEKYYNIRNSIRLFQMGIFGSDNWLIESIPTSWFSSNPSGTPVSLVLLATFFRPCARVLDLSPNLPKSSQLTESYPTYASKKKVQTTRNYQLLSTFYQNCDSRWRTGSTHMSAVCRIWTQIIKNC